KYAISPNSYIYCDLLQPDYKQHCYKQQTQLRIKNWDNLLKNKNNNINSEYILIPEQRRPEGITHTKNWLQWANNTISILHTHTNRPIVIRLHPNYPKQIPKLNHKNIIFTYKTPLHKDLKKAFACCTLSSKCDIESVIRGYHTFTFNTNSIVHDITNHNISLINNPQIFDRQKWLNSISYSHWTLKEIASGQYFTYFFNQLLPYYNSLKDN
ncbi:hypothetical protein LCGC14_3006080, partial [marine sediment metagenome]